MGHPGSHDDCTVAPHGFTEAALTSRVDDDLARSQLLAKKSREDYSQHKHSWRVPNRDFRGPGRHLCCPPHSGESPFLTFPLFGTKGPARYRWNVSAGSIDDDDQGGVVWQLPREARPHLVQVCLEDLESASVMFHKKRGLKVHEMVKSSWVYNRLKRFRAGIAGGISFLKRCFGLRRCKWSGFEWLG